MNGFELHHVRSAELIRQAEHERLVREALRGRRAERSVERAEDTRPHTSWLRRHRHPRAA